MEDPQKMPRFSVIMPLFNKAPYVKKALDSIVTQSFKDLECIIIDDGSTDNSAAICEDFINSLTPSFINSIRVIRQPNSGVAAARNNGVMASHGQFVCFLDADDWWEPEMLEEMDRLIKEYPDAGLYATNYVYFKPGKTHVALNLERGYMNYPEAYLHGEMPVWTGAVCMPRKVFNEMGGFPKGIKLGEDFLLWAKTALHYKVAFCEKALAYYNNDVPAHLRATRNLHAPEHNMLFHLDEIEHIINDQYKMTNDQSAAWTQLLDKLHISGLLDYWLSEEYHDAAAAELKKVDWDKQPRKAKAQYEKPIWLLKVKRRFMQVGSFCKQKLIRLILK
jgi:glycosyltransferase involved in cell wall biosynthesis